MGWRIFARLLAWELNRLDRAARELINHGVVVQIGASLTFVHDLVREAAIRRLPATPEFFMDLAVDSHGQMFGVTTTLSYSAVYATDFVQHRGLYLIDMKTGFETAIAALPFGFSSSLELVKPKDRQD